MNRISNIILAILTLAVLAPLFLLISIFIFFSMGRPIYFIQKRVGLYGKTFKVIKFRTMTITTASSNGTFDAGNTSRVTALGKFLRKTKLDEIPQLINVLKGDMSFVGPRPEVPEWTRVYPDRWKKVHSILPGITDPASITFRNEEELLSASSDPDITYRDIILPKKLGLSEDYVDNRSFFGDITILVQTLFALIK